MEFRLYREQRLYGKFPDEMPPLVLPVPERLSVLEGALATPRRFFPDRSFDGAVYDASGVVVPESLRDERSSHTHAPAATPEPPTAYEPDEAIYLGSLMGHYGHFLLEVLPRLWAFSQARPAKVYFHPWRDPQMRIKPFLQQTLNAVAGREIEVRLITEPIRFERLLIPSSTLRLGIGASEAFGRWCQDFTAARVAAAPSQAARPRIYCSRRGLADSKRALAQEPELEAMFTGLGFEVVRPQEMGFFDQVRMFAGCEVAAGLGGSALHNALFMAPGRRTIVLDSMFATNQHIVEAIMGHRAAHFRYLRHLSPRELRFNPIRHREVAAEIERLLAE